MNSRRGSLAEKSEHVYQYALRQRIKVRGSNSRLRQKTIPERTQKQNQSQHQYQSGAPAEPSCIAKPMNATAKLNTGTCEH